MGGGAGDHADSWRRPSRRVAGNRRGQDQFPADVDGIGRHQAIGGHQASRAHAVGARQPGNGIAGDDDMALGPGQAERLAHRQAIGRGNRVRRQQVAKRYRLTPGDQIDRVARLHDIAFAGPGLRWLRRRNRGCGCPGRGYRRGRFRAIDEGSGPIARAGADHKARRNDGERRRDHRGPRPDATNHARTLCAAHRPRNGHRRAHSERAIPATIGTKRTGSSLSCTNSSSTRRTRTTS